jgi:hypothetical protein
MRFAGAGRLCAPTVKRGRRCTRAGTSLFRVLDRVARTVVIRLKWEEIFPIGQAANEPLGVSLRRPRRSVLDHTHFKTVTKAWKLADEVLFDMPPPLIRQRPGQAFRLAQNVSPWRGVGRDFPGCVIYLAVIPDSKSSGADL